MHSTQKWSGKYNDLIDEERMQAIEKVKQNYAMTRTFKDLLEYAWQHYALPEVQVRQILKNKGYEKFCKEKWHEYINVLFEHWPHVQSLRRRQWAKEERLKRDLGSLKIVVTEFCWHYEGTPEALEYLEEWANKERERNVRMMMRRSVSEDYYAR